MQFLLHKIYLNLYSIYVVLKWSSLSLNLNKNLKNECIII